MVSAKLLNPNTAEQTHKRKRKIVSISHMSVVPGGASIHFVRRPAFASRVFADEIIVSGDPRIQKVNHDVVFENQESNPTATFDLQKQR